MSPPRLPPVPAGTKRPRISIVLPARKRPRELARMLTSIFKQTFTDFDLHVREDGADDFAIADVIGSYDDPRLRYTRSEERLGIPGVVNALLAETTGDFVMQLHDHDVVKPDWLAACVDALERFPDALYVFGAHEILDQSGAVVETRRHDSARYTPGSEWLQVLLSTTACPVFACGLVRRSAYERAGLPDPDYGFLADVELWLRLATVGGVAYIHEPLISFSEREPTHEYQGVNWEAVDALTRMHRKYRRHKRGGPAAALRHAWMLEQNVIASYLLAVAPPGLPEAQRRHNRREARRVGSLLTRLVTVLR